MKLIALGSNLSSPEQNIRMAAKKLSAHGFEITARAPFYITTPVPCSDQPDFINTVMRVEFTGTPEQALQLCLEIESAMGRIRSGKNAARVIDLDIIAWDGAVQSGPPELPHPRLHERAFVVWPLCDIAPKWVHPVLGRTAAELKHALPDSGIKLSAEQWQ